MLYVNRSRTSRGEVTNESNYTPFSVIYLYGVDRDTFTFNVLGRGLYFILFYLFFLRSHVRASQVYL
jgi:hypothetical protein